MGEKHKKQQPAKKQQLEENLPDNLSRCPNCGSTDISLNQHNEKLRCNYCHHEFDPIASDRIIDNASNLTGDSISSGAADIDSSQSNEVTIRCQSCGAEVVIDTTNTTSARCHWCRSYLSLNDAIPNGGVPDMILPFKMTREEAQQHIEVFVKDRWFFAKRRFKREFKLENIMGVYFPYMIVDANVHVRLKGEGEISVYNEKRTIRNDAQAYNIVREFDLAMKGLTIESEKKRLDNLSSVNTNNIINAIMPFDTENCMKYNSNYLRGFTAEKRDMNVDELMPIVSNQIQDIARHAVLPSLDKYDRGVSWKDESYEKKGSNWNATYLPVWLYSYLDGKKKLHYVAVNARTKEVCGSVPINKWKLSFFSLLASLTFFGLFFLIPSDFMIVMTFLAGPIVYYIYASFYRNMDQRHFHEKETEAKMSGVICEDEKGEFRGGLMGMRIKGENYREIKGATGECNRRKIL